VQGSHPPSNRHFQAEWVPLDYSDSVFVIWLLGIGAIWQMKATRCLLFASLSSQALHAFGDAGYYFVCWLELGEVF